MVEASASSSTASPLDFESTWTTFKASWTDVAPDKAG